LDTFNNLDFIHFSHFKMLNSDNSVISTFGAPFVGWRFLGFLLRINVRGWQANFGLG